MTNLEEKIEIAERLLKSVADLEGRGLDTSSLKMFIRNLKTLSKIQETSLLSHTKEFSFQEKLAVIKSFLEDKSLFPKISDVIRFANEELSLDFKDQKESRKVTIRRVIGRIEETPELKEKVKYAVMKSRNQAVHQAHSRKTVKEMQKVESFAKWAEILMKL